MSFPCAVLLSVHTSPIGVVIFLLIVAALWGLSELARRINNDRSPKENAGRPQLPSETATVVKSGLTRGHAEVSGAADDETVAVILAAVSDYTDIPVGELRVKEIRAID